MADPFIRRSCWTVLEAARSSVHRPPWPSRQLLFRMRSNIGSILQQPALCRLYSRGPVGRGLTGRCPSLTRAGEALGVGAVGSLPLRRHRGDGGALRLGSCAEAMPALHLMMGDGLGGPDATPSPARSTL
eukprot:5053025-Pleurochrysis_carterae.AAC.2